MKHYNFKGTAVVTGAAGGIGQAVAMLLADKGSDLALIDRNEEGLKAVKEAIVAAHPHAKVTYHPVDLSKLEQIPSAIETIGKSHRHITLLVNNAGIALNGSIEEVSMANFDLVMTINFRAQVVMVKELLPYLKQTKGSHIANVSSLFGLAAAPGQVAYSSSKFAVRGFSDVIRVELEPYRIGVSTIYPAGVKTNIARNSLKGDGLDDKKAQANNNHFEKLLKMTPEEAAIIIVKGIEKRHPRVLVGGVSKLFDTIARQFPGTYGDIVAQFIKKA